MSHDANIYKQCTFHLHKHPRRDALVHVITGVLKGSIILTLKCSAFPFQWIKHFCLLLLLSVFLTPITGLLFICSLVMAFNITVMSVTLQDIDPANLLPLQLTLISSHEHLSINNIQNIDCMCTYREEKKQGKVDQM